MNHTVNIGLAWCTPVPNVPGPNGPRLSMVTTEFMRARMAIGVPTNFNSVNITVDGMEVGEARCEAVKHVMRHTPRPQFVFFIDYDVLPSHDCLKKLLYRAESFPDHDIFAGVYCCKTSPAEPLIYKGDGKGPFWDWTVGDLITEGVTGIHMGLTLIRTSLFERMEWDDEENPLFLTQNEQVLGDNGVSTKRGTEDLYFTRKAIEEADARILVDTSVLAGHIDHSTGQIFGLPMDSKPVLGAKWMPKDDKEYDKQKKALDIGAGGMRREWEGYRTYTTDIRGDVGADYVQDTRYLNLPDGHFDLVASSHHLEHLPRFEQEQVWQEIFRITKPGGTIEHIVPNMKWAAAKIMDSKEDEHVLNVLYGAQESHGYKREFNLHYFGYTPAIGKALAESAGFKSVKVKSFEDDESLGYNMVITGTKPDPNKPSRRNGRKKTVRTTGSLTNGQSKNKPRKKRVSAGK